MVYTKFHYSTRISRHGGVPLGLLHLAWKGIGDSPSPTCSSMKLDNCASVSYTKMFLSLQFNPHLDLQCTYSRAYFLYYSTVPALV